MTTLMYIHGYGSTGNALKARKLHEMFPDAKLVSPTFDYDHELPAIIFDRLRDIVATEQPDLIVGSSTGGYYALCCTQFFRGTVWCINPVRDIMATIRRALQRRTNSDAAPFMAAYKKFDRDVFRHLAPADGQLHFALSTDDELLGDHRPLLDLFPNHAAVVWKDHCGHRFFRFDELKPDIEASLRG